MSARARIIAAQAVIVSVLVVVVVATLLRPETPDNLLGIDAPGPATGAFPNPGGHDDEPGRGAGNGSGGNGSRHGGSPAPLGGTAPGSGGAPVPGAQTPVLPAPGTEPSPTDDQYADTLTRLLGRLN